MADKHVGLVRDNELSVPSRHERWRSELPFADRDLEGQCRQLELEDLGLDRIERRECRRATERGCLGHGLA